MASSTSDHEAWALLGRPRLGGCCVSVGLGGIPGWGQAHSQPDPTRQSQIGTAPHSSRLHSPAGRSRCQRLAALLQPSRGIGRLLWSAAAAGTRSSRPRFAGPGTAGSYQGLFAPCPSLPSRSRAAPARPAPSPAPSSWARTRAPVPQIQPFPGDLSSRETTAGSLGGPRQRGDTGQGGRTQPPTSSLPGQSAAPWGLSGVRTETAPPSPGTCRLPLVPKHWGDMGGTVLHGSFPRGAEKARGHQRLHPGPWYPPPSWERSRGMHLLPWCTAPQGSKPRACCEPPTQAKDPPQPRGQGLAGRQYGLVVGGLGANPSSTTSLSSSLRSTLCLSLPICTMGTMARTSARAAEDRSCAVKTPGPWLSWSRVLIPSPGPPPQARATRPPVPGRVCTGLNNTFIG